MEITRTRVAEGPNGPIWRFSVNGQPTDIVVSRGPKPRYLETQEWEVWIDGCDNEEAYLFATRSYEQVRNVVLHLYLAGYLAGLESKVRLPQRRGEDQ